MTAPTFTLAIGAIMRNEAQYVIEWIAHHQVMGFDRFIIADDGSDDGTAELLQVLDAAGVITYLTAERLPGKNVQTTTYQRILDGHCEGVDWLAMIDADELIMPQDARDLRTWLAGQPQEVGAVLLNWAIYGSDGQLAPDDPIAPSPVADRFARRGAISFASNVFVKTISRPASATYWSEPPFQGDCHVPELGRGLTAILSDGRTAQFYKQSNTPISCQETIWGQFRVNHYHVKSRAEFVQKARRGAPNNPHHYSRGQFFGHDRNEVYDPYPADLRLLRNSKMEALKLIVGQHAPQWQPRPITLTEMPGDQVEMGRSQEAIQQILGCWQIAKTGDVILDVHLAKDVANGVQANMALRLTSNDMQFDRPARSICFFQVAPSESSSSGGIARDGIRITFENCPASLATEDLMIIADYNNLVVPLPASRRQLTDTVPPMPWLRD